MVKATDSKSVSLWERRFESYRLRTFLPPSIIWSRLRRRIVGSVVECSPATRAARVRFPDDAKQFLTCRNDISQSVKKKFGGAGYRSRYLSHAKRALYHLSYAPSIQSGEELRGVDLFTWSDIYAQGQPGTSCGYTPKVFPDATNKPSIAQLVERWTVVVLHQKSIGRWFKSGSKEFLFATTHWKS